MRVISPYESCSTWVGFGWDTSFEKELLDRTTHCEIWAFDGKAKSFGVQKPQKHRTHFERYQISTQNTLGKVKQITLETLLQMNGTSLLFVLVLSDTE